MDNMEYDKEFLDQIYNDPELMERLFRDEMIINNQDFSQINDFNIIKDCLQPTITQTIESIYPILLSCLLIRLMARLHIPQFILHVLSCVTGLIVLWKFYNVSLLYVIIPGLIGLVILKYLPSNKKYILAMMGGLGYLLFCELFIANKIEWNKVRGSVMIVCMKIISYSYDTKSKSLASSCPESLVFFGYVFSPASIIFGPFISADNHLQFLYGQTLDVSWFFNVGRAFTIAMATLSWSTCGITSIEQYRFQSRWILAFCDAMAFRFSHYFVSYTSELSCLLMGIGTLEKIGTEKDDQSTNESNQDLKLKWHLPVSRLYHVELPRSLVDVVTNWNLPMHYWLKTYIFKSFRFIGVFPAIILTYTASSLLHGMNFQLSSILLSIGLFAYIEHSVRHTLADIFNACIEARKCNESCSHVNKKSNVLVLIVNFAFALIAMWNLAYLGCLFDNSDTEQEKGYSMSHAMKKWSDFHYINHWIMFAIMITTRLVNEGTLYTTKDKKS